MRRLTGAIGIGILVVLTGIVVACSGGATGSGVGGGSCSNDYSGKWSLSGSCNERTCNVTQSGCSLDVSCGGGTKLSGSLNGTKIDLSGTSADGTNGSCSGSVSGTSLNLSCSFGTANCSAAGTCTTGSCGQSTSGGTSGAPTSSGTATGGSSGSSGGPAPRPTGSAASDSGGGQ